MNRTDDGARPTTAALVLIDVQRGFDDPRWGPRNNRAAERNVARLLAAWREAGQPIFHVQHHSPEPTSPLRHGQPGHDFKPEAAPRGREPVIAKRVNSALIGTDLEERLRALGADAVVIAGICTDHCVSTTARMAANLGFETAVVADASFTFARRGADGTLLDAELVHHVSLASLRGEFAEILDTDEAVARLAAEAVAR